MSRPARILASLALVCVPTLFIAGCGSPDHRVYAGAAYGGYYGGGGWYDPFYRGRPTYGRPWGPPGYRPPSGGGRPANMPSAARASRAR